MSPPNLTVTPLDDAGIDGAAAAVAREHRAARRSLPLLPVAYEDPTRCREALAANAGDGELAVVARRADTCVGVLCARVRDDWALLPLETLAVEPAEPDPTAVLVAMYAALAPRLLALGAVNHQAKHLAIASVVETFANLGFGRSGVYAAQLARPAAPSGAVAVRIAEPAEIETVAALSLVELLQRFEPPVYGGVGDSTLASTRAHHEAAWATGAVHFVAATGGADVGLLTIEWTARADRMAADGQPHIGPTATVPAAPGIGVGRALVDAALGWAHDAGFAQVTVDFEPTNPLSRPFWLRAGFEPVGYAVRRNFDPTLSTP